MAWMFRGSTLYSKRMGKVDAVRVLTLMEPIEPSEPSRLKNMDSG
ncbi:hypothetical protein [Paenibacillus xylanexedens]|nr:hypothetical protein [Paenibacillus xylanexedens]